MTAAACRLAAIARWSGAMTLTITAATLKGGAGKSTIVQNVAACLHASGHRALIVDLDPQGTCSGWAELASANGADAPPVVAMKAGAMRKDLERVAKGWDVVVIDTPPRLSTEQRLAMLQADLVLFPVTPGPADAWALQQSLTILEEARAIRPELRAAIVLNRIDKRTSISDVTRTAMKASGVPVLSAALGNRVAYPEAMATGQGVITYAPSSPAAKEASTLTRAVLKALEANPT